MSREPEPGSGGSSPTSPGAGDSACSLAAPRHRCQGSPGATPTNPSKIHANRLGTDRALPPILPRRRERASPRRGSPCFALPSFPSLTLLSSLFSLSHPWLFWLPREL